MERLITVAGTARERGEMQGCAAREAVEPSFGALASLPLFPSWWPGPARRSVVRAATASVGRFYLGRHRKLLRERTSGAAWDLVQGLAEGAEAPTSTIYGINAFEIESANVGFSYGCTALGLAGAHTEDGRPRLVYNHDFPPAFEPFLRVRRSHPSDGMASLALTYPMLVGAIGGFNEAGLAVVYNQAYATDLARWRPALFVTMLVQECLDRCRTVREALERIHATPVTNGAMLTLVDASGDRAAVELAAGRKATRREEDGRILYTFNKYRCDEMTPIEIPVGAVTTGIAAGYDVHRCNLTRERRFLEMHQGPRSDEALFALMADHDGGAGSEDTLCRHDDPMSETILTAVMDPAEGRMQLLFGKPCQRRPTTYALTRGRSVSHAA